MAERPHASERRAWAYLTQQVAFGPRIPGTRGHDLQLKWMREQMASRADTVLEQPFTHVTSAGRTLKLTNVMARFRPEAQQRLLLAAHWDTRPHADQSREPGDRERPVPGANSGASGVAVLVELAELFRQQRPEMGVDLLFLDGSDQGPGPRDVLLGARHFARNRPAGPAPRYAVVLDMVGDQTPRFPTEPSSLRSAPQATRRVWSLAKELGYAAAFVDSAGPAVAGDHLPLVEAGIPTVTVVDFEYGPSNTLWHTLMDLPRNTSAASLTMVAEVLAELVYRGG